MLATLCSYVFVFLLIYHVLNSSLNHFHLTGHDIVIQPLAGKVTNATKIWLELKLNTFGRNVAYELASSQYLNKTYDFIVFSIKETRVLAFILSFNIELFIQLQYIDI